MKANETMNMMELNEEQLEAVTGGGIVDVIHEPVSNMVHGLAGVGEALVDDIMDTLNGLADLFFG